MDLLCDQHSVPGWDVLLVESITQIPFERYIRETIFEPFGMDSSGFSAKARGKDAAMAHQLLSTSRVLGKEAEMVEIPQWCDASEVEVGMGSLSLISTLADLVRLDPLLFSSSRSARWKRRTERVGQIHLVLSQDVVLGKAFDTNHGRPDRRNATRNRNDQHPGGRVPSDRMPRGVSRVYFAYGENTSFGSGFGGFDQLQ